MMDTVKKRNKSFHWTEEAEKSFNLLKKKITEKPIMVLPYFSKTFQVRCDASGFAIGALLSQDDRPIMYFSEKLNEVNIKYSTYEKEFYVVIQELKKWRHYLVPKEFVLYNDNHEEEEVAVEDATEECLFRVVARIGAREKMNIAVYEGNLVVEEILDWIRDLDKYFDYEDVKEDKKFKHSITRLKGHVTLCWDELQADRRCKGKKKIKNWDRMVAKMKS
jgi:hypothetical protein